MSEQAAGTQVAPEGTEGAAGAAPAEPDQMGQLLEGFNSFRGEITQRMDRLEGDLFEPEEPEGGQGGVQPFEFQPGDFGAPQQPQAPFGAPQQQQAPEGGQAPAEVPQEAAQILDQYIGNRLTQGLQAFEQRLQQTNTAQERQRTLDAYADQIEGKYEEFKDEAATKRLIDATAALAQELGQPSLAGDPRLLERVLLTERAQALAAGEGQQQEVHLEAGGAAAPSTPQGDVDMATGIVNAAQKKRLL